MHEPSAPRRPHDRKDGPRETHRPEDIGVEHGQKFVV